MPDCEVDWIAKQKRDNDHQDRSGTDDQELLGVSVGEHDTCCRSRVQVARCMAQRLNCQEEQAGAGGAAEVGGDEPIDLLMRWYPSANTLTDGAAAPGPPGFSVRLEPF